VREKDFVYAIHDDRPGSRHQLGVAIERSEPVCRSHGRKLARSSALLQPIGHDQFAWRTIFVRLPCSRSSAACEVQCTEAERRDNPGCTLAGTFRRCTCRGQLEHWSGQFLILGLVRFFCEPGATNLACGSKRNGGSASSAGPGAHWI
jgi:hypothetical protein